MSALAAGRRKVVLVDDSEIVRDRLACMLAEVPDVSVAGQASDVGSAMRVITETRPDVVVLDLQLGAESGLLVLERLSALYERPTVVVLTNYPVNEYRRRCRQLGAVAVLDKSSEFDQVLSVVAQARSVESDIATGALPPSPLLAKIVSAAPAVLFTLRLEDGTVVPDWIGPNLVALTGYSPSEWPSYAGGQRIHQDDLPSVTASFQRLFTNGTSESRHRFQHKNGSWVWLHQEMRVEYDHRGQPTEIIGAIVNVTERERAKAALADREARYRALAEATSDAILVLEDGLVVEINGSFTEQYGYAPDDVVGRSALQFVAEAERPRAAARIANEHEGTYELSLRTKAGAEREVSVSARMHRVDGRVLRLLALQDVTSRRALERHAQQVQKMEAVGRLAGNVAHDFNNVLTAINGCVELACMALPDDHDARADLEAALSAVAQGTQLSRQLMNFSRPQPIVGEVAICDVNALLATDEPIFRRLAGHKIEFQQELGQMVPHAAIVPGLLRQCVVNLVMNARDAMPAGGRLAIRTAVAVGDDSKVSIVISDSGVGMTPEVQGRIFEPYFTTKENRGTGLGLASVVGIMNHAGGAIEVRSEVGIGTQFELLIPVVS